MKALFPSEAKGDALTLSLPSRAYSGGETVSGSVEMDYPMALKQGIEMVQVKLSGSVSIHIEPGSGKDQKTCYSTLSILKKDLILWRKDTNSKETSHIMTLPFEFRLPPGIPGSFHIWQAKNRGTISYGVEMIAVRPGHFKTDRRVGHVLLVTPPHLPPPSAEIAANIPRIRSLWDERHYKISYSRQIRRGLSGPYAEVRGELKIPALQESPGLLSLPVGVVIPMSLTITTTTKLILKGDAPPHALLPSTKPYFPGPPNFARQIGFSLRLSATVAAQGAQETMLANLVALGGFGPSTSLTAQRHVTVTHAEPEWIAQPNGMGNWKRQARFDSEFTLKCPAIPQLSLLNCRYQLHIVVPFPGLFNDLSFVHWINVNSGLTTDNVPSTFSADLDELPAYFQSDYHDWDAEEKTDT